MAQQSLEKNKIRFLLLEGVHPSAVEALNAAGYHNIEQHAKALPPEELKAALAGAHFLGIRSRTQLTDDILDAAPRLVAIGCFCIGTNQVDLVGRSGARHCRVQCAVLEHAQRGGAGDRRNHPPPARPGGQERRRPPRRVAEVAANSYEIRGKVLGLSATATSACSLA
jgi:D-3-phosphoglycerate dehydrogenase